MSGPYRTLAKPEVSGDDAMLEKLKKLKWRRDVCTTTKWILRSQGVFNFLALEKEENWEPGAYRMEMKGHLYSISLVTKVWKKTHTKINDIEDETLERLWDAIFPEICAKEKEEEQTRQDKKEQKRLAREVAFKKKFEKLIGV